jgi:hypothetical protein
MFTHALLCCAVVQVMSPGTYDVIVFYASGVTATMKLSIGPYGNIQKGTANSITATLPAQVITRTKCIAVLPPEATTVQQPQLDCYTSIQICIAGTSRSTC